MTCPNSIQMGCGAHLTSYATDIVASFTGRSVKRPGLDADYSPASSAKVKDGGTTSPLPHMS
jgi:hypothetical protein